MTIWKPVTDMRRWPLPAKLLILSSLVTIIGFTAVCGSVMLDMRHAEEALAKQTSENLATSLDSDIGRTIEQYDLSLRAVVSGINMPELKQLSRELRQLILFDNAASSSQFGAIQVFDAAGDLTVEAGTLEPAKENRVDEDFFQAHRLDGERGLFISAPRMHRGAFSVVLSRRITDTEGNFAGVVAGSVRVSYFLDLFDRLRLNPAETITVVRRDGVVILRAPFDLNVIGSDLSKTPGVMRILARANGSYSGIGAIDKVMRLFVWRDSGRPLIVIVGRSWEGIYSLWQRQALRIGAIMLALIAFISVGTIFLAREIGRRARAEDRLEQLATTDALTGLRNRRKFDAAIEAEWYRAIRTSRSIALLLVDADYFKIFNDSFGHQAGDHALMAIARCISVAARRTGDCAARYGGEEFAILLPGVSERDAFAIAEQIRQQVELVPANPAQLSVSIGIACMEPLVTMEWTGLVEAADKALYTAKAAGRNRCHIAESVDRSLAA
jgi:diguanylate cyclase (GGDEF)-like protein